MKKNIILFIISLVVTLNLSASTQAELFNYPIDIPDNITAEELNDYRAMKDAFYASITNTSSVGAENYVNGLVANNWDGITATPSQEQLSTLMVYARDLARAAKHGRAEAQTALNTFLDGLTIRGYKKNMNFQLATNSYTTCKNIVEGSVLAAAMYTGVRKTDWLDFVYWVCVFGQVYNPLYNTEINVDYMYNVAPLLFDYAFVVGDDNLGTRHLKACSRYLARFVEPTDGTNGGLKIDGTGFHHSSHYPNYLYAFNSWFDLADKYKSTEFRISEEGFKGVIKHVMCMYLMSTKPNNGSNSYMANSLAGRNPYLRGGINNQVSKAQFETLLEIGKDITGSYDEELTAAYNYFFDTNSYGASKADLDGFYQFNYSPVGVLRKDSWVATMRAPTRNFWGSEIYDAQNRFGRYQSHGSLEVMYKGIIQTSGKSSRADGSGWDWNIVPGTTTVHYTSWTEMMPGKTTSQRFDQYSNKYYSGALSMGNTGVFATDFDQNDSWGSQRFTPTGLKFKKSFFAFDDMIVALGSNISSNGTAPNTGVTATNLFQDIVSTYTGDFVHNGNIIATTQNTTTSNAFPNWFVTPAGTGYFVPKGQPVTVIYGDQATPSQTGSGYQNPTNTSTAAKAYIGHGNTASNASYEFVVIPGVNQADMQTRATELMQTGNNAIYKVIQKDENAHILKHNVLNQTGYAVFAPISNISEGKVKSIDATALVSVVEKTDTLIMGVVSPEINFQTVDGKTISVERQINVTIKGLWKCDETPENAQVQHSIIGKDSTTRVTVNASKGLSTYFTLYASSEYVPPTTDAERERSELSMKVFPNPTRDMVSILLPNIASTPIEISVYGNNGMLEKKITEEGGLDRVDLNLHSLSTGLYYLQVKMDGKVGVQKILKH